MRLKVKTMDINAVHNNPCGFSVQVSDADTGAVLPYVQKVVLTMDLENFATAVITVAGVIVDTHVDIPEALVGIITRPDLSEDTPNKNGIITEEPYYRK